MAKTTTATAELARLDAAIKKADETLRATQAEAAKALADLPGLAAAEGEAWANGDRQEAERIARRRREGGEERRSWQARIDGAARELDRRKGERRAFIERRGDDLIAEHMPEAESITIDMLEAAQTMIEKVAAFTAVEGRLRGFCLDTTRHRRVDPRLAEVVQACERLLDVTFTLPYSVAPLGRPNAIPKPEGHPGGPRPHAGAFAEEPPADAA